MVLDATGLSDSDMAAFARWTNLSETTFVLPPTVDGADYRLRIFTPVGELPFAGHPTLGSAYAWLTSGGTPKGPGIVQECGAGLIDIRIDGDQAGHLAFAAPPLIRSGPIDQALRTEIALALGIGVTDIIDAAWVANGPNWIGLLLDSAQRVLDLAPDMAALADYEVGVVGPYPNAAVGEPNYEVRAFAPGQGVPEDPITGSLNAGLAMWLRAAHGAPASYVAAQGTVLERMGRVYVDDDGDRIWIGGQSTTVVDGFVEF
ncbi:putative phenazine biosynthesis protein [Gordonia effusa NBRC 100432]|uniref:Putative phenazine biosynthesis protein n=1 Tax=Gordonia effusa NBRC 100432 TaxID=1077974 RepID=H0QUQ3_9ACTN|nr:putative phenazine biosynthesis protein [Gordonia effusa NBRC 100432]